ncbi:synaptogyrin-4-like [Corticium candelabrum]|uniref:synaptogyrin-4-like n=1 Tax=Corticium candelabrum TaxID=121492 RepID=UPI002E362573|nr:synaptogyrin-4-like [Corticium candelabrum]
MMVGGHSSNVKTLKVARIALLRIVLYLASLIFSIIVVGVVVDRVNVTLRSVPVCWFDINRDSLPCDVAVGVGVSSLVVSLLLVFTDTVFDVKQLGSESVRTTIRVLIIVLSSVLAIIWLVCFGFLAVKWKMVKDLAQSASSSIAARTEAVIAFSFLCFTVWIAEIVLASVGMRASRCHTVLSQETVGSDL